MTDNWYITANGMHWIRCEIVSMLFGIAVIRLYNSPELHRGSYRRGAYGLFVSAA